MNVAVTPLEDADVLTDLALDAERDGHRMVSQLISDWKDGTNRFTNHGESLYVATLAGDRTELQRSIGVRNDTLSSSVTPNAIGVCGLNVDPYVPEPWIGRVRRLYVSTAHCRLGIGSALVDRILADARNTFTRLRLRTRNPEAAEFYVAKGFVPVTGQETCTHELVIRDLSIVRETERLRLEPIGPQHTEDLHALHQDPGVAEWYGTWTMEAVRDRTEDWGEVWRRGGVTKWMAYNRRSGELVGRGGLSRVPVDGADRIEIGWIVRSDLWGNGYATEIGRAGLALAFDELGADEVVAFTEPHNARSRAVMERLGMRYDRDIVHDGEPFVLYTKHPGG
jgi:[ribosomal protein S5]-alanine N-acetyltransferase